MISHRTLFNVINGSLYSFPPIYFNEPYFAIFTFYLVSKYSYIPSFAKGKEINTSSATINIGKNSKKLKSLFPL